MAPAVLGTAQASWPSSTANPILHYFASRHELFASIFAERDAAELELIGANPPVEKLAKVRARSTKTPGLVRLFFEMAAAAPDPENAAHAFFAGRYVRLRAYLDSMLRRSAADGGERIAAVGAVFLARILVAASDGLQLQWLLNPSIEMESDLLALAEALGIVAHGEETTSDQARPWALGHFRAFGMR